MTREIRIEENGLRVKFLICENGVVELQDFSSSQVPEKKKKERSGKLSSCNGSADQRKNYQGNAWI